MNYKSLITETPVVLVEFFATWCPHCRQMMPVMDEVKELLEGRAKVVQLDIDQNTELSESLNVTSVPTFIVYRNGEEQWRTTGEVDGQKLLSAVESLL